MVSLDHFYSFCFSSCSTFVSQLAVQSKNPISGHSFNNFMSTGLIVPQLFVRLRTVFHSHLLPLLCIFLMIFCLVSSLGLRSEQALKSREVQSMMFTRHMFSIACTEVK